MFGKFFQEIIGKSASDFESIVALEVEIERVQKKHLEVLNYESSVVPLRGSIFKCNNKKRNLNNEIDVLLTNSRPKLCI